MGVGKQAEICGVRALVLIVVTFGAFLNFPVVKAGGVIYIRADGHIDGTLDIQTADEVNYFFTADINGSLIVERNNILIDGKGYSLQGSHESNSIGADLSQRENVTIQNLQVRAFHFGLVLNLSSENSLSGSNIANNFEGILLDYSTNNSIKENNVTDNYHGIFLDSESNYNTLRDNNITNNDIGIFLAPSSDFNDISTNKIE